MSPLEAFRKSEGLSQSALAERLGLRSKASINMIENGHRAASLKVALQLDELSEGRVPAPELVNREEQALLIGFVNRRLKAAAA